VDVH